MNEIPETERVGKLTDLPPLRHGIAHYHDLPGAGPMNQPISIQDFASLHALEITTHERTDLGVNSPARFYAHFKGVEVKDGKILRSEYGDGRTEAEAVRAYAAVISGKLLVVDAYGPTRKLIQAPVLIGANSGGKTYRIKPLEWTKGADSSFWEFHSAGTPMCSFTVERIREDCDEAKDWEPWRMTVVEGGCAQHFPCDSLENGKAKAEAYWRERVSDMIEEVTV
jgi:hypothetical protein